jgi:hypothetical protein
MQSHAAFYFSRTLRCTEEKNLVLSSGRESVRMSPLLKNYSLKVPPLLLTMMALL